MKKFSELGISASKRFIGDKIKASKVLNKNIIVYDYKIDVSKYPKNKSGECLTMQIGIDGEKRVLFTGSDVLIEQIKLVDRSDFPFETSIVKNGECFEFQ
jgi:hypothetical protein